MDIFEIIFVGIALSMDAFAIALANCTTCKSSLNKLQRWSMPVAFGVFQFLMPVIGFALGSLVSKYLQNLGIISSIVFFVLSFKIVYDNLRHKDCENEEKQNNFSFTVLIIQAIATSIDALVVGVTFAISLSTPVFASLLIGAITFVIVSLALVFGKVLKEVLGKFSEWAGAVILFVIAVKELLEVIL